MAEIGFNIYDRIMYFSQKHTAKVCENETLEGIVEYQWNVNVETMPILLWSLVQE